jgi:hypothetical protein
MGVAGVAAGVGATAAVANTAKGFIGAGAASKAGQQEAGATQEGIDFQNQVWDQTQSNFAPYIGAGQNALDSVSQLYGLPQRAGSSVPQGSALDAYNKFTQTPFYQFPLQQGTETMNRSGAARGLTLSGGQFNALQQSGQGYASSNFDKYIAGLSSLANLGQSSVNQLGQFGQSAAGNLIGARTNQGIARAAGTVGSSNQIGNALGQAGPAAQAIGGLWGPNGPFASNSNTGSSYSDGSSVSVTPNSTADTFTPDVPVDTFTP